jgi:hypothetical protein
MQTGKAVTYVDERGISHAAIVTAVWPGEYGADKEPGINLVFVSHDEKKTDDYGRQTERRSSVVHRDAQKAHGNYWML